MGRRDKRRESRSRYWRREFPQAEFISAEDFSFKGVPARRKPGGVAAIGYRNIALRIEGRRVPVMNIR